MEDAGGDVGREGEVAASFRESLGAAGKAQCSNSPRTESLQGRCGYAASAFCDSLRNCAWALPATCRATENGAAALGKMRSRPCPPCRVRTVGTFVWEVGWRGRCGEGWVEVFNVLTGGWGGKRDISQPVARGVVSVGRKAASLCVRDANLRRMS